MAARRSAAGVRGGARGAPSCALSAQLRAQATLGAAVIPRNGRRTGTCRVEAPDRRSQAACQRVPVCAVAALQRRKGGSGYGRHRPRGSPCLTRAVAREAWGADAICAGEFLPQTTCLHAAGREQRTLRRRERAVRFVSGWGVACGPTGWSAGWLRLVGRVAVRLAGGQPVRGGRAAADVSCGGSVTLTALGPRTLLCA